MSNRSLGSCVLWARSDRQGASDASLRNHSHTSHDQARGTQLQRCRLAVERAAGRGAACRVCCRLELHRLGVLSLWGAQEACPTVP